MAGEVHRLKDILVEEVSIVDRAANKRRFLIVKGDGDMGARLVSDGRGGFTRARKSADDADEEKARKAKEAADAEETEKAKKPGFPGAAPPFGAGGKPGEPETKKADASGGALAGSIRELVDELESLCDELEDHEADEPSDVHMKKLAAAHKKLGAAQEKYMSKDAKKADFKKALSSLSQILATLTNPGSHEAQPGDPQKPAAGWSPANPSMVPSGSAGTAGGWTGGKRDASAAPPAPAVPAEITKALADATAVAKAANDRAARLEQEVRTLKSGVQPPNSSPAGEGTRVNKNADVPWPLDMNRPLDRNTVEKVDKSTSFYDED